MHIFTHLSEEYEGTTGLGIVADGMKQHDTQVGQLLDKLDELGITENTIVIYTTDNGAEKFSWPDGGTSPFRGEKASTWEGGIRVPFMIRWPGKIEAGVVSNEIFSLEDCLPTLLAAAGDAAIKSKLLKGHKIGDMTYKVHLDGYNYLPYLTGETEESPRNTFFAYVDDGTLGALRYNRYKFHFSTQTHHGIGGWNFAQEIRKAPLIIDLRADPFEEAPEQSSYYDDWLVRHMYVMVPLQNLVAEHMKTFQEFPVRQEPGSFTPKQ
jgi:arylsulfatase